MQEVIINENEIEIKNGELEIVKIVNIDLNKAHLAYLESEIINLKAKAAELEVQISNQNTKCDGGTL